MKLQKNNLILNKPRPLITCQNLKQKKRKNVSGLHSFGSPHCDDITVCDLLNSLSVSAAKSDSQHEVATL